jgi:hypothetical protein
MIVKSCSGMIIPYTSDKISEIKQSENLWETQ